MAVAQEKLKELNSEMPYKFRVQSTQYGKTTVVSYIDARQLFDKLDEVCGIGNWQSDFRLIDGKLFGGIGILVEGGEGGNPDQWVWKWDTGTESNVEKEKGEVSDSIKRAGVQWGVGRFLYSQGIITLKAVKHTNQKEYPSDDEGKILWTADEVNKHCLKVMESGQLDRTKPTKTTPPASKSKTDSGTEPKQVLPELTKAHKLYDSAIKNYQDGKMTLEYIKGKFTLSKELEDEIKKLKVTKK